LLPYAEVPISLILRGKPTRKAGVSLDEASDEQIEKIAQHGAGEGMGQEMGGESESEIGEES
jgi:hypothetical protein